MRAPVSHEYRSIIPSRLKEPSMTWQTPSFADIRFGFEVTMYIANR